MLEELPHNGNAHRQEHAEECREHIRGLIILVERIGELCANHGEDRSCQNMKQVVPPSGVVIQVIHCAKQRTEGVEGEQKIERQVHSPTEKNAHDKRQRYERNRRQAIKIAEHLIGRKGNVDHRQKAEEAQCRGQGNLEHGKPEAV